MDFFAYRPFRHVTFRQESFWHGCFITGTFRHVHHSALQTFRQIAISTRKHFDKGTFRHEDFSARGIFGTGTFRHMDISTSYCCTIVQSLASKNSNSPTMDPIDKKTLGYNGACTVLCIMFFWS